MNAFWAHSPDLAEGIQAQPLEAHLRDVAQGTMDNGRDVAVPSMQVLLRLAGLLHDLGKYKLEFQHERLGYDPATGAPVIANGKRVDHSSLGAVVVFPPSSLSRGRRNALLILSRIIAAHHSGLTDNHAFEARISEKQHDPFRKEALEHALVELPELHQVNAQLEELSINLRGTSVELLTRIALSCLVDADQTNTEAHCNPETSAARSRAVASLSKLLERLESDQSKFRADSELNRLRSEMYFEVVAAATEEPGFFRLTMPTGAGKTRTSLAFALKHALEHDLRRVIYAIPYTSIIDQTAQVFRAILNEPGEENVLEHHSALETARPGTEETQLWAKLMSETWNVPLVVTTTVQLFESLFANKTGRIRKLHNVVGSVIVLDEVQTLPTHLLQPILDVLSELVARYRVSVVFCTATQPALSVDAGFDFAELIGARDLIANPKTYFKKLERVHYHLDLAEPTPWESVANEMQRGPQVLSIVNLRRHAQELYALVREHDPTALHLSTFMFPAHRKQQLRLIRRRLRQKQPCRVVATQLIECGVDVDFPAVFRALGPLDAIVQAAGRCNREGALQDTEGTPIKGHVWVFRPNDAVTPQGDYFVKVQKAQVMLERIPDLTSHEVFTEYFRDVYQRSDTDANDIQKKRHMLDFGQTGSHFRMIDADVVPVVITALTAKHHRHELQRPQRLLNAIESHRISMHRELWRELQMYTVGVYRHQIVKLSRYLRQVCLPNGEELELYEWAGAYDHRLGIQLEDDPERFII